MEEEHSESSEVTVEEKPPENIPEIKPNKFQEGLDLLKAKRQKELEEKEARRRARKAGHQEKMTRKRAAKRKMEKVSRKKNRR